MGFLGLSDYQKMILRIYLEGFHDELKGVANNLFISDDSRQAYEKGRTDAMLGKDKILKYYLQNI